MRSEGKWCVYVKPWERLMIVLFPLIVLCGTSCKSPSALSMTHYRDSLESIKKFERTLAPVPPSVAKLRIPSAKLASLPQGAGYSTKSGQATITVTKRANDSIDITGTCDSLAREVILLQEELTRRGQETQVREQKCQPTGWQWFWIRTGQIALLVLFISFPVRMFVKRPG